MGWGAPGSPEQVEHSMSQRPLQLSLRSRYASAPSIPAARSRPRHDADRLAVLSGVLAAVLVAMAATVPAPARAQIPSKFENLKVLPRDISRDSLVGVMRGFALGLGVRCQFCHVGEEGQPFSEWKFRSDEKATKRKARFMLRMVNYLNEERLPGLPTAADAPREDPPVRITCRTCHHGVPVPRALEEILTLTAASAGTDSALAEYGHLRDEYYGQGAYDFGELTLVEVADGLLRKSDAGAAEQFLELNLRFYPRSVLTYVSLARTHEARGDTAGALTALGRAAALHPPERDARRIQAEIRKLGGTGG
jgi:hypothetical protein